jgi:AcrR family transcriptional regulator
VLVTNPADETRCPRRRRLRSDAQRNRSALADAAREVFAERGLDAPLDQVAKRARVGIATLYRHFPTRAELLDAVLADMYTAHGEMAGRALAAEDPLAGLVGYLTEACELGASAERTASQTMAAGVSRTGPLLAELLARAQAAGQVRADLVGSDLLYLALGVGRVIEATEGLEPGTWRRQLALAVDGLRPGAAHALPAPPRAVVGARECGVDVSE